MKPRTRKKPVRNRTSSGVMSQRELADWYASASNANLAGVRNAAPRRAENQPRGRTPTANASEFAEMMHEAGLSRDEIVVAINNQGFSASDAAAAADAVCNARGGGRFDFVRPILARELTPSEAEGLRRQRAERAETMARVRRTENAAVLERVRRESEEAVANRGGATASAGTEPGSRALEDVANERARRSLRARRGD